MLVGVALVVRGERGNVKDEDERGINLVQYTKPNVVFYDIL